MITPPPLQPGDTVAIVSTARKITRAELQPAIDELRSRGYQVQPSRYLYEEDHQFAGTDAQRTHDLQHALDDDTVKAILCARGGYGTVRIIDDLDFSSFLKKPKWVCGYSDVTVLHNKLTSLGIESLHSTMPINFNTNSPESLQSLFDLLEGKPKTYHFAAHSFNRKGNCTATLTGGNLSMLYSQCGSPTALQTAGAILFIEDLDEYLYHIDRMMYNLKRNGYFENLKGMIVGGMSDMNDNTVPFGHTAEEIIKSHLEAYDFPVCFGFPAGHLPNNLALVMGRKVSLSVSDNPHLSM